MPYQHAPRTLPRPFWPALVILQAERDYDCPLKELTVALAEEVATTFDDAVVLLTVQPHPPLPPRSSDHGVVHVAIDVHPGSGSALDEITAKIISLKDHYAYLFVDSTLMTPSFRSKLLTKLGDSFDSDELFLQAVLVTDKTHPLGTKAPKNPQKNWKYLRSINLGPAAEKAAWYDVLWELVTARAMEKVKPGLQEPRSQQYPGAEMSPTSNRMRISWDADQVIRGDLSGWARAVTRRRVGLALGGSGALGYANVALIQELTKAGVPIDLLTSTSSGSVIGAYYAAAGADGLQLSVDHGALIEASCFASMATTPFWLQLVLALDLGNVDLDQLDLIFVPTATNLTKGRSEYLENATVPWAVRASSTVPGMFGATFAKDGVFCDGAITNNVPAQLVDWLGADLTIAANPLPPPRHIKEPEIGFVPWLKRTFLPGFRVDELSTAFSLMLTDVGKAEANTYQVTYNPAPADSPLLKTFEFSKGAQIVEEVRKQKRFQLVVDQAVEYWTLLAAPRYGRVKK